MALFQHFWRARGETRPLEPGVLQRLEGYDWPGNVRELENLVERVSVIAEGTSIRIVDLPPPFCDPEPGVPTSITDLISARNPTNLLPTTGLPLTTTMPPPMRDGLSGLNGTHEGGAAAVRSAIESTLESAVVPVVAATMAAAAAAMDGAVNSLPDSASPLAALPSAPLAAGDSIEVSLHTPPPVAVAPAPLAPMSVTPEPSTLTPTPTVQPLPVNLPVLLKELEEAYIAEALTQSGGNKKEAARLLGMGRTTLVEKLRRRNADTQGS